MKINQIELKGEKLGIESDKLIKLGQVVALVGKNGSGKSRVLQIVKSYIDSSITLMDVVEKNIVSEYFYKRYTETGLELLKLKIEEYAAKSKLNSIIKRKDPSLWSEWEAILKTTKYECEKLENSTWKNPEYYDQLSLGFNANQRLDLKDNIRDEAKNNLRIINSQDLRRIRESLEEGHENKFEQVVEGRGSERLINEFDIITHSALHYLKKLPHKIAAEYHECLGIIEKLEKKKSYQKYLSLQVFVKNFLNKKLVWKNKVTKVEEQVDGATIKVAGEWMLEGRQFSYQELSNGEKILFSYSLLFFLLEQMTNSKLKNSIIIIDEPEINLHPESQIYLLNGLRKVVGSTGQIWIATHSLSILSNLKYEEIFLVVNGKVYPPNRSNPNNSINELLGLQDHVDRLSTFVSSSNDWAYVNFMLQCLNNPEVVNHAGKNDPQVELFLASFEKSRRNATVLDFGAGTGRIYKALQEHQGIKRRIKQYFAFEIEASKVSILEDLGIQKVYKTLREIPYKNFNLVLLCNVLHEIPISSWVETINALLLSLKSSGYIVMLEVAELPVGEKIEEAGFIVLDKEAIQSLFQLKSEPLQLYSKNSKYNDKILCTVIDKRDTKQLTKNVLVETMKEFEKRIFNKLRVLRTKQDKNDFALGRKIAFYSQLYINSRLAIDILHNLHK